jgi:hypothetical protein
MLAVVKKRVRWRKEDHLGHYYTTRLRKTESELRKLYWEQKKGWK